jgi:ABC-type polysaccharide/polyol phosphate export permease
MKLETVPSQKLEGPVYEVIGEASWQSWTKIAMLVKHMTWRSLASRYRGSALGFIWSLVNPVLMMLVYTLVFRYIFHQDTTGVYMITGILAWNFMSAAAIQASVTLLSGASLVNKAAFPRIVLPLSAVFSNAVNYVVALPLLLLFVLLSGVHLTATFFLLPLALLLLIIIATGLGAFLATLMPFFQDLQHLIEVFFMMWFFMTPIVYNIKLIQDPTWRMLYSLNPMVGIIQLVHSVFLGQPLSMGSLAVAVAGSLGILAVGLLVFRRFAKHCTEV